MTNSSLECNHEKIKAVDDAFERRLGVHSNQRPKRDLKYDCERMTALSQKIAELSAEGVADPTELRRLALEAWPLWQEPMERRPNGVIKQKTRVCGRGFAEIDAFSLSRPKRGGTRWSGGFGSGLPLN